MRYRMITQKYFDFNQSESQEKWDKTDRRQGMMPNTMYRVVDVRDSDPKGIWLSNPISGELAFFYEESLVPGEFTPEENPELFL